MLHRGFKCYLIKLGGVWRQRHRNQYLFDPSLPLLAGLLYMERMEDQEGLLLQAIHLRGDWRIFDRPR